jgi:hypothetical protein
VAPQHAYTGSGTMTRHAYLDANLPAVEPQLFAAASGWRVC